MEVVCDTLGRDFQDSFEMFDCLFEKTIAFKVLQIADVLAEECVLAFGKTNCVLQLATDREDRRYFFVQENRNRDEAPRAAELLHYCTGSFPHRRRRRIAGGVAGE